MTALSDVRDAVYAHAIRTPLVAMPVADDRRVSVKLECLQPTGSFKIRGAAAAYASRDQGGAAPVVTASAGNMGRAVAHLAAQHGRDCVIFVPDHAPPAKVEPMTRLGAEIRKLPFAEWWQVVATGQSPIEGAVFVHPFLDENVLLGNGTIGEEIVEAGPVDAVLVPWGGGGLSIGIARAIHRAHPDAEVFAVEIATGAPLTAALRAGEPVAVDYQPSFVDGIGSSTVVPQMLQAARDELAGTVVVSVEAAADGVRLVAQHAHAVVEGASGAAVAAALDDRFVGRSVISIASGGNINLPTLGRILAGEQP